VAASQAPTLQAAAQAPAPATLAAQAAPAAVHQAPAAVHQAPAAPAAPAQPEAAAQAQAVPAAPAAPAVRADRVAPAVRRPLRQGASLSRRIAHLWGMAFGHAPFMSVLRPRGKLRIFGHESGLTIRTSMVTNNADEPEQPI